MPYRQSLSSDIMDSDERRIGPVSQIWNEMNRISVLLSWQRSLKVRCVFYIFSFGIDPEHVFVPIL